MKIGVGIPNPVPGTSGQLLLDWARRAEERGFSGLATIDRVIYPSFDQLSGGRLTLGLAPGGRPDDYAAVGQDFHTRGQDFDDALEVLHRAWSGEDSDADSRAYLRHYHRFLGEYAEMIAEGAVRTDAAIRDTVTQFEDVGVSELYFDPTVAILDQVDRLADLVL